ncbi:hypothetical protein [Actinokineospora iranica]|uniref:Uncharacterized protein n=1 Tax=Actinokineospora iranica TaxID=1271860 RepID=A0A1G6VYG4_9PSEU|nr:hypothetical protein [Actinokineospora iranica]SDD58574.1 hypothetical protein SAMN05216174_113160 [Actinokineospora iranica]
MPVLVDYTPADGPAPRARTNRVIAALEAGWPVSAIQLRYLQSFMATLTRKAPATAPKAAAGNGQALVVGNTTDHARGVFRVWEQMLKTGAIDSRTT